MFTDAQDAAKKAAAPQGPTRKFMFDLSFDDASVVHRAAERKPVLMKPDQLDALKQEAGAAGFEEGKAAGRDEQTAQLAALLGVIDRNVGTLLKNLGEIERQQDRVVRETVLAVARKILPAFVAKSGTDEIEAVIGDALREMAREPRLVIRVHESQFDAVNEKAQALAAQRAYSGKLIVLADDAVAAGDCRVEWADGGVERNAQATWNAVERAVDPAAAPSPLSPPSA